MVAAQAVAKMRCQRGIFYNAPRDAGLVARASTPRLRWLAGTWRLRAPPASLVAVIYSAPRDAGLVARASTPRLRWLAGTWRRRAPPASLVAVISPRPRAG